VLQPTRASLRPISPSFQWTNLQHGRQPVLYRGPCTSHVSIPGLQAAGAVKWRKLMLMIVVCLLLLLCCCAGCRCRPHCPHSGHFQPARTHSGGKVAGTVHPWRAAITPAPSAGCSHLVDVWFSSVCGACTKRPVSCRCVWYMCSRVKYSQHALPLGAPTGAVLIAATGPAIQAMPLLW
jgi:hypothetical protein